MKKPFKVLSTTALAATIGISSGAFASTNEAHAAGGEKPVITAPDQKVEYGKTWNPLEGIKAYDKEDGDLSNDVYFDAPYFETNQPGVYNVTYGVWDSDDNQTTTVRKVNVLKPGESAKPEQPEQPTKPEQPEQPEQPTKPEQPEQPTKPGEDNQTKPGEDNQTKPGEDNQTKPEQVQSNVDDVKNNQVVQKVSTENDNKTEPVHQVKSSEQDQSVKPVAPTKSDVQKQNVEQAKPEIKDDVNTKSQSTTEQHTNQKAQPEQPEQPSQTKNDVKSDNQVNKEDHTSKAKDTSKDTLPDTGEANQTTKYASIGAALAALGGSILAFLGIRRKKEQQ